MKKLKIVFLIILVSLILVGCEHNSTNDVSSPKPIIEDGYIYFGEYPQTLKKDNVKIKSSNPDSNGYYKGSDGNRYVKVFAKPSDDNYKFNDETTSIVFGNTYYFKVEPIKWKIEEESDGIYKLVSTIILDCQRYYIARGHREIEGKLIYANNYEHSDIRKWLNNNFLNIAFTEEEQTYINTTKVDNSLSSTTDSSQICSFDEYICNDTLDKIYLPSVEEMTNTSHGDISSTMRQKQLTDYAKAKGCYMSDISFSYAEYYNNGYYWLRSPYNSANARYVTDSGRVFYDDVSVTNVGVVPALTITIK